MSAEMIISFIHGTIVVATPLIFAAIGEALNQRSGIMNLGLEGVMLVGAVSGYMTVIATGSLFLSVLVALLSGFVTGLLFGFIVITLKADQTVTGLAITIFGTGFSAYIGKSVSALPSRISFQPIEIPLLSKIPIIGPVFFRQDILVYLMIILVVLAWFYIYKTKQGLVLRSLGESPATADALGVNVFRLRYLYTSLGSALAALGGAYLTLAYTPLWAEKMTSGKGWIALAIVIFATWNPLLVAVGALMFGGIQTAALRLQVVGVGIPSHFLNMLPYVITLLVLIFSTGEFGGKKKGNSIKALGLPYDREDR